MTNGTYYSVGNSVIPVLLKMFVDISTNFTFSQFLQIVTFPDDNLVRRVS